MSKPGIRIAALLWFLLFVLCLAGFYETSLSYFAFRIAYGTTYNEIPTSELTFSIWFLFFGLSGAIALTKALARSSLPARIEAAVRKLLARPRLWAWGLSLICLAVILLLRFTLLQDAPITDDESTYVFIARTLLHGRVINPLPGDNEFFRNQFILFNSAGWYGKYPIGHPLMLALGEAASLRFLIVPLLSFASLLMTYVIGRKLFGEFAACLALGLLALSPQFMLTSATQLSQPTGALFMLLGLWATMRAMERERWPWALAAGAFWAFGILVRPFPGGLFFVAAGGVFLLARADRSWREQLERRVPLALVALVPVVACAALMLWINRQQTGQVLSTGYQVAHGGLGFLSNRDGQLTLSVVGALLRQNFWLFGWPLSFIFLLFARRKGVVFLWVLIAAEYAYRILVPKTVVSTTGPIYVMEIVPLLALLSASGMIEAKRWLERRKVQAAKAWVISFVVASTVISFTLFLPLRAQSIYRGAQAWNKVFVELAQRGVRHKALVFTDVIVPRGEALSWAFYPPPVSPSLDDDVVFVLALTADQRRMVSFWKRRFPSYSAWRFDPKTGLSPLLATAAPR